MPGLIFRVGARRRTWSFRFHSGGSYHRQLLGHFPVMSLADAREAARRLITRLDSGAPAEVPAPHPRATAGLTLGGLLDRYEAMRLREGQRIKTLAKSMRVLRQHLKPYLGLPATEFSKNDLRSVRDGMAGTTAAANRLLASLSPALKWASEEDLIAVNFVSAIRRTKLTARKRVLNKAEIAAVWHACDKLGRADGVTQSYSRLIRFLLLTGQRLDEAASLKHGHILGGIWRQVENKSDRPHTLPLPELGLELIGQGEARDYVFPGRVGKIGNFSKLKRRLDKTSGVTDWRVHDLRRTAASMMQDLGVPNHVVEAILNHALPGVAAVYLRAELEKQKAQALATWATALGEIVGHEDIAAER
jgi:integrase